MASNRSNKYSLSRGPGALSGWYCTLKTRFSGQARPSANVITDRETGRSRGFGFVEMPNETEGQAAIDALDGTDFEGKTIGVNVAKPKADRPAGGYGGGNRGGGYGGGYGNRRY